MVTCPVTPYIGLRAFMMFGTYMQNMFIWAHEKTLDVKYKHVLLPRHLNLHSSKA